jgi:hypothetical protein
MLRFTEREAWRKTPYQIVKLFKYHKEYNPLQFGFNQNAAATAGNTEQLDDIDIALGGL